jgi:hypothetical protein
MFRQRLTEFFFPLRSTSWIAILRIGLALQLLIYAISLRRDWNYLFAGGNEGLINRNLTEDMLNLETLFVPRFGWLITAGHHLGLSEESILTLCWLGLFVAGLSLLVGFLTRPAAISGWILHLAARGSGGFISYGVDQFMTIGLFYLSIAPLPDRYSLDYLLRRKTQSDLTSRSGFQLRILQVHLCLIYFFGGLAKSLGAGWWNGTSIWRALTRPPFNIVDTDLLLHWSVFLPAAGIAICVLEIGYPVFIWLKWTRAVWLCAIVIMHTGIALLMGLHSFAFIMIALNTAAFGADLVPSFTRMVQKSRAPAIEA